MNRLVNTKIDFVSHAPTFSHRDLHRLNTVYSSKSGIVIPDKFDWITITSADSPIVRKKKKLITRPPNQYLCGSCWAVATVTCISDRFVVAGVVDWNPDISATYAMAHYPQGKCNG